MSNPWTADRLSCVSLGSVDDVLAIAAQEGYESKNGRAEKQMSCHSDRLIRTLSELSKLSDELDQVLSGLHHNMLCQQVADLTSFERANEWSHSLQKLANHLSSLLSGKETLLQLLREPLSGDYISLDASYHQVVAELFPAVVGNLSSLPSELELLDWIASTLPSQQDGRWLLPFGSSSQALAALQKQTEKLMQAENVLQSIAPRKQHQ